MTTREYAEQLKRDVERTFASDHGLRTMQFLEQICFFYLPTHAETTDKMLINDGKREVVLTLKTIMRWPVDKIEEEIINQLGGE